MTGFERCAGSGATLAAVRRNQKRAKCGVCGQYAGLVPSSQIAGARAIADHDRVVPRGLTPLFDVVISVSGDDDTGGGVYDVTIVDRYDTPGHTPGDIIGRHEAHNLADAMQFARGAVTAFMKETQA